MKPHSLTAYRALCQREETAGVFQWPTSDYDPFTFMDF
jgi:hypothetical protein